MKKVNVRYGGFSAEQEVDENLYDAIYQQAIEDMTKCKDSLCHSCKQYDRKHFNCPIWCKTIRGTVEEIQYESKMQGTINAVNQISELLMNLNISNPLLQLELKKIKGDIE